MLIHAHFFFNVTFDVDKLSNDFLNKSKNSALDIKKKIFLLLLFILLLVKITKMCTNIDRQIFNVKCLKYIIKSVYNSVSEV